MRSTETSSAGAKGTKVAWYNFCRKHETLGKQTPAMASGLTDHVWTLSELLEAAAN